MNDLEQKPADEQIVRKDVNDEISLIDLFVVLIKYRRLIIIFAVLGLVVSAAYYGIRTFGRQVSSAEMSTGKVEVLTGEFEGYMTVAINPRLGRSGTERFPTWFNSRELIKAALEEAELTGWTYTSFAISYSHNDEVNIVLKPGIGDKERVERLFSILLNNVEAMAAVYYTDYAEDIISYFESLRDMEKDYSAQDYIRYCWARDFLAGDDTVLKALYPPFVFGEYKVSSSESPQTANLSIVLVIFFAFLFFAVFLAFVLNAIKNISGDGEAMTKIRGALGKKNGDGE
jgi:hypothetical protein